jgi:photosystem II stability/assembly factor-like uncharacterized protein
MIRWSGRARAFPDSFVNPGRRVRAFKMLDSLRRSLDRPYIPPPGSPKPAGFNVNPPNYCIWHSLGPTNVNGRVTDIALAPNDPTKILLATVGGVWRSQDAAATWERVSDLNHMLSGVYSAVAFNPGDAREVFAAGSDGNLQTLNFKARWGVDTTEVGPTTPLGVWGVGWRAGGPGVWRSQSGGAAGTWSHTNVDLGLGPSPTLDEIVIYRLVVASRSPFDIYLATDIGIVVGKRTTVDPAAITWRRVGDLAEPCSDFVLDESGSVPIVYAGAYQPRAHAAPSGNEGIWRFDDALWTRVFEVRGPARCGAVALAISSGAPKRLYARIEDERSRVPKSPESDLATVLTSTDGVTWSGVPDWQSQDDRSHYADYNSRLYVDPDDAEVFFMAGVEIRRHGPTSWSKFSYDSKAALGIHRDQHCMAIGVSAGKRWLYVGSDGGLDRLEIPSVAQAWLDRFNWQSCDHGLDITDFYDIAVQSVTPMAIIGGTQDNGAPATFGNKTWHDIAQCDALRVAADAPISSTIYEGCSDGYLAALLHPVPLPDMTARYVDWNPDCKGAGPPVAAHPQYVGIALAASRDGDGEQTGRVLELGAGGNCWRNAGARLHRGTEILCLAIGGSSPDTTYYVGFVHSSGPSIWSSRNGGSKWQRKPKGLPKHLLPTRIVIDRNDPAHAYAGFGGAAGGDVYMTNDWGANWQRLVPTTSLVPVASVQGLAMSPDDPNEIYVGIEVGVLKGTVHPATSPTVTWTPFDFGLPDGVDVTSLAVNDKTKHLVAGTLGYGAFECPIGNAPCWANRVLVRDNVFDRGVEPSPSGVPDPEYPLVDAARSPPDMYYKHNDTNPGGLLWWWDSEDVRVSVPGVDPEPDAWIVDPVTVETCPVASEYCPPGTIPDEAPRRGKHAHVYVQVHNAGFYDATNIRVLTVWTEAASTVPRLPNGFWTQTFPAGATACGNWPADSAWRFFDDASCTSSFQIIPRLRPDQSAIVTYEWMVPPSAGDHCCVLVFVESDQDPLPSSVRTGNVLDCSQLVPNHHQIAQRNLHLVGWPFLKATSLAALRLWNSRETAWQPRIVVAADSIPANTTIEILLPTTLDTLSTTNFKVVSSSLRSADSTKAKADSLDLSRAFRLTSRQGEIRLTALQPNASVHVGALLRLPAGPIIPWRFSLVAARDSTVLGGSRYVITGRK